MSTDVARLDVSARRWSVVGYTMGMAVYVLVVVALYPAFEHSSSLDQFVKNDSTAAALFGVSGPLSSTAGWLNGNIYANFFPLVMLFLTIGYGAACLAGQDDDGTLGLIVTLPIQRTTVALQKVLAMAVQAAIVAVAVAGCVFVGRSFDLAVTLGHVTSVSAAVWLMALDFGLITMTVGAYTGKRSTALGIGSALATVAYMANSLATVVSWMRLGKYLSLFYWSVGDNQIQTGVTQGDYAVMIAVGLCAVTATLIAFQRLDLH